MSTINKSNKRTIRREIIGRFTISAPFTKTRYGESGYPLYDKYNNNIGVVYRQNRCITHLNYCEIRFAPEYEAQYQRYHRFQVLDNGIYRKLPWVELVKAIVAYGEVTYDMI